PRYPGKSTAPAAGLCRLAGSRVVRALGRRRATLSPARLCLVAGPGTAEIGAGDGALIGGLPVRSTAITIGNNRGFGLRSRAPAPLVPSALSFTAPGEPPSELPAEGAAPAASSAATVPRAPSARQSAVATPVQQGASAAPAIAIGAQQAPSAAPSTN